MSSPSFLEQRRIDDTLRAMLRRTLFHALGREPTEAELDVQVRREFAELSRQLRSGFAVRAADEESGLALAGPPPPARKTAAGDVVAGTWLSPAQLKEAEATAWYTQTQGIPSVLEAVRWYHVHHGGLECAAALLQCVDEYLCVKRAEGCAPMTLAGYRSKLERFARAFPGHRPSDVSANELGRFIVAAPHPRTRRDWWQTLYSFYAWCWRMKYVAENPLPQALAKPKPPPGSALVLTPAETKAILRSTKHTDQIGFWALALFAGLRTEEIRRLQAHPARWALVRLRSQAIDLPDEVAKTHARIVPILPVLRPWLELVKEGDLPFFPPSHYMKCRRLRNAVLEDRCGPLTARHRATNPQVRPPIWAFNIARRSYISYRLACAGANYAELSHEVGNSEAMIRQHYFRHVSRQAARAYFSLTPDRV